MNPTSCRSDMVDELAHLYPDEASKAGHRGAGSQPADT